MPLRRLWLKFTTKKWVGRDPIGNRYYEYIEELGEVPKRGIRFHNHSIFGYTIPDVKSIPVEWHSWLHYKRDVPPSDEEQQRLAEHRAMIKKRAEEWETEDRKMRLQELAARGQNAPTGDAGFVGSIQQLARQMEMQDQSDSSFRAQPPPQQPYGDGDANKSRPQWQDDHLQGQAPPNVESWDPNKI